MPDPPTTNTTVTVTRLLLAISAFCFLLAALTLALPIQSQDWRAWLAGGFSAWVLSGAT